MINIWHLAWIIPVTFAIGLVACGMAKIGKREKELRAEYDIKYKNYGPEHWSGGFGA